jgi:endonuclease/exonuclease/phosphatase family metal-dependent hydrolase
MKKLILYLAIGVLSACELTTDQNTNMEEYQGERLSANNQIVAFYNVENLFDLENDPATDDDDFTPNGEQRWDKERYDHKLNQISKVLYDLGSQAPMLIGLVEIENHKVVEDLSETGALAKTAYKLAHFDSEDRRGIDCALLYDSKRFEFIEKENLKVRLAGNKDYLTRDILYVKGKVKGDEIVHVFVNHWSSRREGIIETEPKRIQAAKVLKDKIAEIREENASAKILVMGDFNDEPKDKSIQQILNAAGEKASLFNLMAEAAYDGEGTIVHEREWLMFDQMMVSQNLLSGEGLKVKDKKGYVYRVDEILYTYKNGGQKPNATYGGPEYYGGFSDHLPVYLILEQ